MNIKFNIKNETKINAALDSVNGRASDHTYTTYADFAADAWRIAHKIEKLLGGKKYCIGAKFSIESGDSVLHAYKYSRIGTRVLLECRASGWFITDIQRVDIYSRGGSSTITFTQAHHEQAVKVLAEGYFLVED